MPLSDLQAHVARTITEIPEAQDFVLAGGAAMSILGIGDRTTNDLDYFATAARAVDEVRPAIERGLRHAGLTVTLERAEPGFARYVISDAADRTLLDLAYDYRLLPPQQTPFGPVLDRDELAADKTLALFGRAEPRDFVDVYQLRASYTHEQLCDLAVRKDPGFDRDHFRRALDAIARHDRAEFGLDDRHYTAMRREFANWAVELGAEVARKQVDRHLERRPPPGRDPPGIGRDL